MEENRVSIDLKDYNEFVISQYENGKIKTSLLDDIKRLRITKESLIKFNEEYNPKSDLIMNLVFKRNRMISGSDNRSEHLEITDTSIGSYAGFSKDSYMVLKSLDINVECMLDFINKQWNTFEEEKKEKEKELQQTKDEGDE